jgi:hypothetical protein
MPCHVQFEQQDQQQDTYRSLPLIAILASFKECHLAWQQLTDWQ